MICFNLSSTLQHLATNDTMYNMSGHLLLLLVNLLKDPLTKTFFSKLLVKS